MKKDILVIGGGPAGMITALTAKSVYPEKSVCLVKDVEDSVIPCAIPYMMYTLSEPEQNKMGTKPLEAAGIDLIIDKAEAVDPESKTVKMESGKTIGYERLVLATGTAPVKPPIPGIDKEGVYVIEKSLSAMSIVREKARNAKNIVILGGGFIGSEFADELAVNSDANIYLLEMMPKLLSLAFDDEFCDIVEEKLKTAGVNILTGRKMTSVNGDDHVKSVTVEGEGEIPTDLVIMGIGGKPKVDLARDAGLLVSEGGSIWVDAYMRTSNKDIFAVGDCALKRDFFTRQETPIWLASTGTAEARIAGTNIFGIRVLRQIQGTVSAFSTKIGDTSFASAGLTQRACEKEGFRYLTATAKAPDRHPGMLPGGSEVGVKLIFADRSGALLGGQAYGGDSVGELINAIAIGIQMNLNVRDLDMMQIATHPLLTSAPTVHPLINAAHQALAKLRSE